MSSDDAMARDSSTIINNEENTTKAEEACVDALTTAASAIRIVENVDVDDAQTSTAKPVLHAKESETTEAPATSAGTLLHQTTVKDENGFLYYRCRFCGLTFNYMTTLKAHERVHDIDTPYTCNKCGESFHFMCELEYHAKSHRVSVLEQKGYKCDCGRTFYQYTDLLYHHHPGEDSEPAVPPTESSVTFQRPAIHPNEFPTPEFMEKGFEPKHPLKVYSEVRSKPYICQYCSKSYSDSRGLAYHMYSHRGERLFNPRASRYLMCRNENSYISPGVPL